MRTILLLALITTGLAGCASPQARHDSRVDRRYDRADRTEARVETRHDNRYDRRDSRRDRVDARYGY